MDLASQQSSPQYSAPQCGIRPMNISQTEKMVSLAAGAYLGLRGLSRGGVTGLLATGMGAGLLYRGLTGHCQLYQALGISSARHPNATVIPAGQGVHVHKSIVVKCPSSQLYEFWNDVENLPLVMTHIAEVTSTGAEKSHWVAEAPMGLTIEWDAEVFNRVPGEMIAWRSLPGSQLQTAGTIRFETLLSDGSQFSQSTTGQSIIGERTEVTLSVKYNPPGGKLTDLLASLFGRDLHSEIERDLETFKQKMEASIATL